MDKPKWMKAEGTPLHGDESPTAEAFVSDDIEPLDDEVLASIATLDRNADPELSSMIRAALALAEQEERQEEARRPRPPDLYSTPRSPHPTRRGRS